MSHNNSTINSIFVKPKSINTDVLVKSINHNSGNTN